MLLVADGPVDAADEPAFDAAAGQRPDAARRPRPWRTDLKLFAGAAAGRRARASATARKDWLAVLSTPSSSRRRPIRRSSSCRRTAGGCCCRLTVPIFDSGQRHGAEAGAAGGGRRVARDAAPAAMTQARLGGARGARGDRERASAAWPARGRAADQAQQVVQHRQRQLPRRRRDQHRSHRRRTDARATPTSWSRMAEDTLRRARLELLTALGRFPWIADP